MRKVLSQAMTAVLCFSLLFFCVCSGLNPEIDSEDYLIKGALDAATLAADATSLTATLRELVEKQGNTQLDDMLSSLRAVSTSCDATGKNCEFDIPSDDMLRSTLSELVANVDNLRGQMNIATAKTKQCEEQRGALDAELAKRTALLANSRHEESRLRQQLQQASGGSGWVGMFISCLAGVAASWLVQAALRRADKRPTTSTVLAGRSEKEVDSSFVQAPEVTSTKHKGVSGRTEGTSSALTSSPVSTKKTASQESRSEARCKGASSAREDSVGGEEAQGRLHGPVTALRAVLLEAEDKLEELCASAVLTQAEVGRLEAEAERWRHQARECERELARTHVALANASGQSKVPPVSGGPPRRHSDAVSFNK